MKKLWETAKGNVTFVFVCLLTFAVIAVLAKLFEKAFVKKRRAEGARYIAYVAMFSAIGGVLMLLHKAWGFGSDAIAAPQATLMKVVVEGIMDGGLPWDLLAAGAGIAAAAALCRVPVMPLAIGIYLPAGLNAAIFLGGMLKLAADRRRARRGAGGEDGGTLFSAGLIAGEGLCGILLAVWTLLR